MSYQVCPLCKGTGYYNEYSAPMFSTVKCSVCEGQKIISELTGRPPVKEEDFNPPIESRGHTGTTEEDLKNMYISRIRRIK